jgi:hypothetical protein
MCLKPVNGINSSPEQHGKLRHARSTGGDDHEQVANAGRPHLIVAESSVDDCHPFVTSPSPDALRPAQRLEKRNLEMNQDKVVTSHFMEACIKTLGG